MKGRVISQFTPQNKLVGVNNKFGNTNIKNQQGTTRVIFDSLPLDGSTELRFFENASSRQYPFTNIGAEGNRLNVGESFVVQKVYFGTINTDPDTGAYADFEILGATGLTDWSYGEWSFLIANSQVIKQLPFSTCFIPGSGQAITAVNQVDEAFSTFTDIVIPPLLEYVLTYRIPTYTAVANTRLVCFIEGTAGILAPQTTF
jgi:hypothetical protein